jgi:dihydropyrimidinase
VAYDLIVRGGLVATATDSVVADLGIRGGRIATIDQGLPKTEPEIDASGLVVVPGGVDVHTHLDLDLGGTRTADDFESGTAAAACGGVTTICDYAWQTKGATLAATLEAWKAKAAGRAHVDYGFHVILSEATDAVLRDMPALVGAGFPSVKVFTIREFGLADEALLRVMRAARAAGAMVNVHCENSDVLDLAQADLVAAGRTDPRHYAASRPALAEVEATRRVIDYA